MRFLLTLHLSQSASRLIPINYQYPIASWIYHTLAAADKDYASWLHNSGYRYGSHFFKLFTFSALQIPNCRAEGDRLRILGDQIQLQLSFYAEEAVGHFIQGLFARQSFSLGDNKSRVDLTVTSIARMPEPGLSGEEQLRCLSPICVSQSRERNGRMMPLYLHPDDEGYQTLFFNTLIRKYLSVQPEMEAEAQEAELTRLRSQCQLQILSEPRSRLITIKAYTPQETKVRAYQYEFKIEAPEELMRFGYAVGFGEKGSLGMGMVE